MDKGNLQKKILREMARIAFADCTKVVGMTADGTLRIKDTDQLPAALRSCIAGIKTGTKGAEVKFYDKLRALELLYKMVSADETDIDHHMTVTLRVAE